MVMVADYVHIELETAQSSKRPAAPCGDVCACNRTAAATSVICADGIGTGIRASIAARMCASRVLELLKLGFSLRKAFAAVVHTMQQNRDPSRPFAAFSLARILNDGTTSILTYEAPPPILVGPHHAAPLPLRSVEVESAIVAEADCWLEPGDGLLLMSDGITQAGLGCGLRDGWKTDGVARYVSHCLTSGNHPREIPEMVHKEARRLSPRGGDDCTVLLALCRRGQVVNLLTGPPQDPSRDRQVVRRFMEAKGLKIVCGGKTAEIVANVLGRPLGVEQDPQSLTVPPRYEIEGVDLVTEGAITLNQVYNVLDEPLELLTEDSGVTELCTFLQLADRVNLFLGGAQNRAHGDITFRQQGILARDRIVPLIVDKLRAAGKLVVMGLV
ncbi:MAG: SpoIIE family protein phosphatase [Thermoguttaceae bacterium]